MRPDAQMRMEQQYGGKALQSMGDEHIKFALNSAVDTLPHNTNLTLWGKRESDACPLCGERQTLIHTFNTCRVARDDRCFNTRHDAILREIATIITLYLPPTTSATSDLGSYNSPSILLSLTYAPTLYGGMKEHGKLVLVELTIPFETSFEGARERKMIKYEGILQRARDGGYRASLITLEVGSRGVINLSGFHQLKKELRVSSRDFSQFSCSCNKHSHQWVL